MTDYKTSLIKNLNELKEVFAEVSDSELVAIVQQAGINLALNIAQNDQIDKFSAAAALYELCRIDTLAFMTLAEQNPTNNAIFDTFIGESPKMLAQMYAAIHLLSL